MEYNGRFNRNVSILVAVYAFFLCSLGIGVWLALPELIDLRDGALQFMIWFSVMLPGISLTTKALVGYINRPLKTISDTIVFAGHSNRGGIPPTVDKVKLGKDMVIALTQQVYDLASMSAEGDKLLKDDETQSKEPISNLNHDILDSIGVPIIQLGADQEVLSLNRAATQFFDKNAEDILGRPIYDAASIQFPGDLTLEEWIDDCKANKAVANNLWDRVRIVDAENNPLKQFNLAAHFTNENTTGLETVLAIFDRTSIYNQDDAEVGYVALAVHELRTPLTAMRGFIEVFEDELTPHLTEELAGYLHKMKASAQQLTAFVSNILNVARIEENQLSLKLQKHNWKSILESAVEDTELRAKVYGKKLELHIDDNIPEAGVDRISIQEVLNNLIDNAIKYSEKSHKIVISSGLNSEGLIETSVEDFGIGIPQAVMPNLFQKFYRSYKSRVQIGGTGLGLYLCKALIHAHGGNIWVRSKEGEGSKFSFTVLPFEQIKDEQTDGQDAIIRGAHGWIKNHSMTRR